MKVFIDPNPGKHPDKADGGIRRVIDAQMKYLPRFGFKITRKIADADLTVGHVDHLPIVAGKPFISHNHGMMWSEYFNKSCHSEINRGLVNALIQADAITVPSKWVRESLSYGMLRTPTVVYHGVDASDWEPGVNAGYVLWNKARADEVSNPQDMLTLADKMPSIQFVATIGAPKPNIKICGVSNYSEHKSIIQNAGVYLVTARETFGIGTLEALASGVPVAGWDYGGQSEIILQGETGYLAPFGDYAALIDCVNRCIRDRERLSANARQDVLNRWQWVDKIEQYANLYSATVEKWNAPRPKVSVIVPCHNLARYLPDALNSLKRQTMQDFECIVVDDASTDNTAFVASEFTSTDDRFTYIKTPENLKLSRTLNFGHSRSTGRYVINLDADNMLPDNTLAILSDALDHKRDVHIVYGGLDTVSDDGTNRKSNAFPYPVFSWYEQIAHMNQLHSSAMMRREVIEQSAGYRERQWRAEDAELWTRVSSFGFRIERVTTEPTLIYRWRQGSKSSEERKLDPVGIDGDWCEYFPWRTARTGEDGKKQIAKNPKSVANPQLVPFSAQGLPVDRPFWNVYHRQDPLISVIIPVGNGHKQYLNDALDSLVGQLTNEWEAIVVNDTDEDWDTVQGAPFARVIKNTGKHGAGAARNVGINNARGSLLFFLDADDMLHPNALIEMARRYAQGDVGYVYCDALVPESPIKNKIYAAPEFTQDGWLKRGLHSQAVLIATEDAKRVGGFNEEMPAWEDWDFFIKCITNGICGVRVGEPLILYRKHLGRRSDIGDSMRVELLNELKTRYKDYTTGAKTMGKCGGCGSKKTMQSIMQSRLAQTKVESPDKPIAPGHVRMKYTGPRVAPVTYYSNKHPYQAANTPKWRLLDVPIADVEGLKAMGVFVEVQVRPMIEPIAEPQPIPEPAPVIEPQPVAVEQVAPKEVVKPPEPPKVKPPVIDAAAMQAAVKALEEKTGQPIQPHQRIENEQRNQKPVQPIAQKRQSKRRK